MLNIDHDEQSQKPERGLLTRRMYDLLVGRINCIIIS